jgi:hypothetical protein
VRRRLEADAECSLEVHPAAGLASALEALLGTI